MRTVQSLGDDSFGEVWLARNAGWLDGVGCERGGDDALAALADADARDVGERDTERKAVWVRAKACVGEMLFLEKSGTVNEEALTILHQCSDAADWFAALTLGTTLQLKRDLQQHEDEGVKLLEKAATLGSVVAMNDLGTMFESGDGVQKDRKKATQWLQRAAECGFCNASTSMCYLSQRGCESFDESKAFHHCAAAADSGEPTALNNLGLCYENGIGVTRNPEKAFSLYSQAYSLSKSAETTLNLGRCYVYEIGTKQDLKKGLELLNKAIEMGQPNAMAILGHLLISGKILEEDKQRGTELLRCAAGFGHTDASLYLSILDETYYVPAQTIQEDTTVPLFQKLCMTGITYLNSKSRTNCELGFDYIQSAVHECERILTSDQGQKLTTASVNNIFLNLYVVALYFLGQCYEEGTGVSKDEKEAVKCYERGLLLNLPLCALGLANCYENGIGVDCNKEKAFKLFKRASDLEDDDGMFHLGRCYENGIGVEVDKTKALELYCRASKLGNKGAKDRLRAFDKSTLSNELQSQSHP